MKKRKIGFRCKGGKINLNVLECNFLERFRGLMFRNIDNAEALLLFNSKKPVRWRIHSFFVFSPFVAVWLDDKNKVVDLKVLNPFTLSAGPKKPFNKLIEIPINDRYKHEIELLVGDAKI